MHTQKLILKKTQTNKAQDVAGLTEQLFGFFAMAHVPVHLDI